MVWSFPYLTLISGFCDCCVPEIWCLTLVKLRGRDHWTHPSLKVKSWLVSHLGVFCPPPCILLIETLNQSHGGTTKCKNVKYEMCVCVLLWFDFWIILKSINSSMLISWVCFFNTTKSEAKGEMFPLVNLAPRSMSTAWGGGFIGGEKLDN